MLQNWLKWDIFDFRCVFVVNFFPFHVKGTCIHFVTRIVRPLCTLIKLIQNLYLFLSFIYNLYARITCCKIRKYIFLSIIKDHFQYFLKCLNNDIDTMHTDITSDQTWRFSHTWNKERPSKLYNISPICTVQFLSEKKTASVLS